MRKKFFLSHNVYTKDLPNHDVRKSPVSIFEKANIKFASIWLPLQKEIEFLKRNVRPVCAYYYGKTAEREKLFKYTNPLGVSDGYYVVTRKSDQRFLKHSSLKPVLEAGVRGKYLENTILSEQLAKMAEARDLDPIDKTADRALHELLEGSFDFVVLTKNYYSRALNLEPIEHQIEAHSHYEETISGSTYHIVCSKKVSDDVIRKLNMVIGQDMF